MTIKIEVLNGRCPLSSVSFGTRHSLTFMPLHPTFRALRQASSSFLYPFRHSATASPYSTPFPIFLVPSSTFLNFTSFSFCFLNLPSVRFRQFLSRPSSTLQELPRSIRWCSVIFLDLPRLSDRLRSWIDDFSTGSVAFMSQLSYRLCYCQ
jgi:hypothetical protein